MIETKERFLLRKEKIYLLSREERGEVDEFIKGVYLTFEVISNGTSIFCRKEEW